MFANRKKKIILLAGLKRSGKDTFATMLQEAVVEAGWPVPRRAAWADALKKATTELLNMIYRTPAKGEGPFTLEMMSDHTIREGPFPGPKMLWGGEQICLRTVLQKFGTEICRNHINKRVWIDALLSKIGQNNVTIITDCRFPNEILEVQKAKKATHQIFVVLIRRPGLISDGHASESSIQEMLSQGLFTHTIENAGDLNALRKKATRFVTKNIFKKSTIGWFATVRGMRDQYPEDQKFQNWLFQKFRAVSQRHGFQEYQPSLVEPEIMYKIKSGEEIVDQMFGFETREHQRVTLRPEGTPSLVRMLAKVDFARSIGNLPLRWFSITQCFRFESVGPGRSRDFFQWNADIIGSPTQSTEIDLLLLLVDFFQSVGLTPKDVVVRVSDRKILQNLLTYHNVTDRNDQNKILHIIDRLEKVSMIDAINSIGEITGDGARACKIIAGLTHPSHEYEEFGHLFAPELGLAEWIEIDLSIVRGLDYYTGFVFEAFSRTGGRAICGGGRYDNLMTTLTSGTQNTPMIGFGFGDCVIKNVLQEKELIPNFAPQIDFAIVPFNKDYTHTAHKIARQLRAEGKSAVVTSSRKVSRGYDYANRVGAQFAVLVAPDELVNGEVRVKDMRNVFDPKDKGYNVRIDNLTAGPNGTPKPV